jgi:hypothetical protein
MWSVLLGFSAGTRVRRFALVRIELLLDHSLRPRLLAGGLMSRLELLVTRFADPDNRNILDSLDDPKIALGHEYSFPQFGGNDGGI